MSKISNTSNNIKKKISFDDYGIPSRQQANSTESQHAGVDNESYDMVRQQESVTVKTFTSRSVNQPNGLPVSQQGGVPSSHHASMSTCQHVDVESGRPDDISTKQYDGMQYEQHDGKLPYRPKKYTFYLDPESIEKLKQVYIKHLQEDSNKDRSTLIREAIDLLFNKHIG